MTLDLYDYFVFILAYSTLNWIIMSFKRLWIMVLLVFLLSIVWQWYKNRNKNLY